MTFLIQETLKYSIPLMIVALAGVYSERSGIINLALEGIMIIGAFVGVLCARMMQEIPFFATGVDVSNFIAVDIAKVLDVDKVPAVAEAVFFERQLFQVMIMAIAAAGGAIFSLLLSFASINLRADQTIGGTALNLLAPAISLFLIRIIVNQNTMTFENGGASVSDWFLYRKTDFGYTNEESAGFFVDTFLNRTYLATYVCIILFVVMSIILYKTRFGLRLRSCGENPQAADSLGINVTKMRYAGVTISGALAGMGGFVYALTTQGCTSNGDVAGFGFLALAVMIFGNWKPLNIAGASLLFGLFKCISASYTTLDINGDGKFLLNNIGISSYIYRLLPFLVTLLVLALTSKNSRAPKAEGIPYDKGKR